MHYSNAKNTAVLGYCVGIRILLDQTASILSLDRNYLGALPESQFISPGWEIKENNARLGKECTTHAVDVCVL